MRSPDHRETPDAALDFERAMLPHLPDVIRYARSLSRERAAADDLVQETFLRAYRGRETYQPESDARRWLFAICRHEYLRIRRREQRFVDVDDAAELEALASARLHVTARRHGYDQLFSAPDLGPAIVRAMTALPDLHREVIAMIDIEGLSYADASRVLAVPVGTIRSRLFRARRVLQEALIDHARDAGLVPPANLEPPEGARS